MAMMRPSLSFSSSFRVIMMTNMTTTMILFQTPFTSRFGRELAKSRSSHFLKSTGAATDDSDSGLPSSSAGGLTSDDDNLSSWARYLKNKYGSKTKKSGSGRGDSNTEQVNNQVNNSNYQQVSHHRNHYFNLHVCLYLCPSVRQSH